MEQQKYSCPQCNGLVDYGSRFCPDCGYAFGEWGAAPQSAVPQQADVPQKMGFKELFFSSKGRVSRKTYWCSGIVLFILIVALATLGPILGLMFNDSLPLYLAYFIVLILGYCGYMVAIKRCHDLDKSGWYLLKSILIVPGFKVMFKQGTVGPNKYGPDPLAK